MAVRSIERRFLWAKSSLKLLMSVLKCTPGSSGAATKSMFWIVALRRAGFDLICYRALSGVLMKVVCMVVSYMSELSCFIMNLRAKVKKPSATSEPPWLREKKRPVRISAFKRIKRS